MIDGANGRIEDTAEEDRRVSTSNGPSAVADAGPTAFERRGGYVVADIDVIATYEGGVGPRSETQNDVAAGRGNTEPGAETQSRVVAAGGDTIRAAPGTHSRVVAASEIKPGVVTDRYVGTASKVGEERINTHCLVETTSGVGEERVITDGVV